MDQKLTTKSDNDKELSPSRQTGKKPQQWKKPVLEDVSGRIMAQPYIRFT